MSDVHSNAHASHGGNAGHDDSHGGQHEAGAVGFTPPPPAGTLELAVGLMVVAAILIAISGLLTP